MSSLSRCPACESSRAGECFPARGVPVNAGLRLVRCSACGLGWTDPPVPKNDIGSWYPPAYYGKKNARFHRGLERIVRLARYRRARVILRRTAPSRVLDVGCGRGAILGFLKSRGYETYATEISETAAWHARHLGIDVRVGDFITAPYKSGFFQTVIFWHTLEHFADPFAALRRAHSVLKSGGLLVVAVPNSESLQARLTGPSWFHLDIPRHYYHFGRRSLERALRQSGFQIVQTALFSLEQDPYGWVQSLMNMMGFKFNFLYDWLKNRSSRMTPLSRHPFQSLGISLLLPLIVPISLALTLLEALMGRSGTTEIYAIKR